MTDAIPPIPPQAPRANGRLHLRFEDVTQDGRLVLESMPTALGPTVWRAILDRDPGLRACYANGVFPILSRLVLEGTAGPFSPNGGVEAEGASRVVRAEDGRTMLEVWADLYAPIGRIHQPVAKDGPRALAGRVFGEHVFTRPFAPPGRRRVTALDFEGAPEVRETRPPPPPFEASAALPPGAKPLEEAPSADATPIVFGLAHTDGNMHVNSLAYLRVFEEAALRRFVALGRGSKLLCRHIDIAYRKPCFAGQIMRVLLQPYEADGKLGVVAVLADGPPPGPGAPALHEDRPHVFARMTFEP